MAEIAAFVNEERHRGPVYPSPPDIFRALELTPLAAVRAVIVGQDPYHGPGQADGLAFSVRAGTPIPPSLRNILVEISSTFGWPIPESGSLEPWASHGILLLNAVLTVGPLAAGHRRHGWEALTGAILATVAHRGGPVAFLLWGKAAQHCVRDIDLSAHVVRTAAHPSPLSIRGYRGKAGFAEANRALIARGADPIDWSL